MKNKIVIWTFISCITLVVQAQKVVNLNSPNGKINLIVRLSDKIYYDISCENEKLLTENALSLNIGKQILGNNPKLSKQKRNHIQETIKPVVPLKFSTIKNEYNQIILSFKDNYALEFRAFNDGIAYRFITSFKDSVRVKNEEFCIHFPDNYTLHIQQPYNFRTAYEEPYEHLESAEWRISDRMSVLPILIDTKKKYKILFSESDLHDYPCMFLKGTNGHGLSAVFPKVPLEYGEDGDRSLKIEKEYDYIAKTSGARNFPWRYFVIVNKDKQLLENTMNCKLADKNKLEDVSWIKPGQVSWEWWNDASPYGPEVNFESGYNMNTYKYYIDFAAKFGIPYIIMDEGWAKNTYNPYIPNPTIDLHELISYGKEKNVGIILWLTWLAVENNFDLFKTFNEWGIKGIKVDFMNRSDQWMVSFYERIAKEAAKNHLFVDFHGAFKPAGLEYKYPNILSYEGVRGMEQMGDCNPDNSIYLPFIRNAVGPMDYTPGAMISMQPEVYAAQRPNAASIGTRAYQMALFVMFESGLQMLADNPTLYYRNAECSQYITQVPTTWDETIALEAKIGEYAIVAKRKGNKWFIGGITNNKYKERTFEISLNFLNANNNFLMTSFEDGINANRQAMDYRKKSSTVNSKSIITIKLARNGGFAAVIE